MQFTPITALVGGLTLGIAAVAKFAITGRVLGISGALKGFVQVSTASRGLGCWLISRVCRHTLRPNLAEAKGCMPPRTDTPLAPPWRRATPTPGACCLQPVYSGVLLWPRASHQKPLTSCQQPSR